MGERMDDRRKESVSADVEILRAPSGGIISAIVSKSAAHRLLIAAVLSGIEPGDRLSGLSQDITATKQCLRALREACDRKETVTEPGQTNPENAGGGAAQLPCGESGSTLRFLIPVAGTLGIDADFLCEGRLPDRPMEPFLKVLSEHGCRVDGRNPKELRGRLTGGDFCLPGNISSQYVTGLLMALPLADQDSRVIVEGTLQSRPYIDLTLQVLSEAGIEITEESTAGDAPQTIFCIPGRQTYRLPETALDHVEGDWSNGAFWIIMDGMLRRKRSAKDTSAGGAAGEYAPVIECRGLDPASAQGDKQVVSVLRRMEEADGIKTIPEHALDMHGESGEVTGEISIDVGDIPDLVPALAVYACSRPEGAVTNIVNAGRLRFKESDRLKAVTETLSKLGADITELPEGLVICSRGRLNGGEVTSFSDHRIAMMAASAACIADGEIVIRGARAVDKSYPGFFEDYERLGGEVRWL